MGRATVKMELITNEKNRKTTYLNRKNGLLKKAKELSILCDVNTVVIIYPPPDHCSNHPEIWPENADQIKKTIASYKDKKNENGKRVMYDVKDYLQSRKRKIEDELVRTRGKIMEAIYPTPLDGLNSLSECKLKQFAKQLEQKEYILKARLQLLKKTRHDQVQTLDDDIMSSVDRWFDDPENKQMAFESMLEINQLDPSNHCVGSESDPTLDQPFDDDVIIHDFGWFDDLETPFEFQYNHDVGSVDQVESALNHDSMISHDFGCLECAPTTSFTPQKPNEMGIRFDYPALEDDEQVYDNSKQCCLMPEELAVQEDSHVIEAFVIDDSKQCCPEELRLQEDSHVNDEDDDLLEILMKLD